MRNVVSIIILFAVLVGALVLIQRYSPPPRLAPASVSSPTAFPSIGARTKESGCQVQGPYPDKDCTPGAIFPDATKEEVCVPGYSRSVRNVTAQRKRQVYRSYGILHREPGEYQVDHFIPLKIGGSNDIANLWPERGEPRPGFHEKDRVENFIIEAVCSGRMPLAEAQQAVADDWVRIYQSLPERYKVRDNKDFDDEN